MGNFRTEIEPNYTVRQRELGKGDDSIRVTTTYTEEEGKEYPSADALKKAITRGIFNTNTRLAGYNVLTVLSYVFWISGPLSENILLAIASTVGFVGITSVIGIRHNSLEKYKNRLTSQGYALSRFTDRFGPGYSIIEPTIKGFLSTFRRNP